MDNNDNDNNDNGYNDNGYNDNGYNDNGYNNSTDIYYHTNTDYAWTLLGGVSVLFLWGFIHRGIISCIKDCKKDKIGYIRELDIENSIQKCESLCAICLEEYTDTNKKICILPCNHTFHKQCIEEWWKKEHTCPFCRRNFSI